jgi:hypothetical protein
MEQTCCLNRHQHKHAAKTDDCPGNSCNSYTATIARSTTQSVSWCFLSAFVSAALCLGQAAYAVSCCVRTRCGAGAVVPGLLDAMSACESKGDEADREVWRHRLFNYLDKAFGVRPPGWRWLIGHFGCPGCHSMNHCYFCSKSMLLLQQRVLVQKIWVV